MLRYWIGTLVAMGAMALAARGAVAGAAYPTAPVTAALSITRPYSPAIRPAIQATTVISTSHVSYQFGQAAVFTATLALDQPLQSARLFFQEQNGTRTRVAEGRLEPGADGPELTYTHDLRQDPLRPFTWIDYHWEVALQDGSHVNGPLERFYYRDNRFAWNMLEEKPFRVFWYEGDVPFAQAVLDSAQQGMIQVQHLAPLPVPASLDIYVYADFQALQDTLTTSSASWVAGHADPDLGIIVAAIPPGIDQQILTEQRVPHELMHILLYQATNLGYRSLPTWLNEGLATQAELYPSSDYALVLEDAVQRGVLIPMTDLCRTFPRDASQALLAYAQSASFVEYIRSTYGSSKLQDMISAYANGMDCERGAQNSLGRSLTQLERGWRRDALAEDTTATTATNLLPWGVLLLVALAGPLILMVRKKSGG